MIWGVLFRGFWSVFLDIFGKCELVKISVSCTRELDFQGFAGLGSVCFVLLFWGLVSGWLWEWIFSGLGMDLGSILAPKINKKRDRFLD